MSLKLQGVDSKDNESSDINNPLKHDSKDSDFELQGIDSKGNEIL